MLLSKFATVSKWITCGVKQGIVGEIVEYDNKESSAAAQAISQPGGQQRWTSLALPHTHTVHRIDTLGLNH